MPGEPEPKPSELESREGITYELVIQEPVLVPELPIDCVPQTDDLDTYGSVKRETRDPIL